MDFKTILGDSYSEAIETAIKAEVGKTFIPKEQYNKKVEELTSKSDELTATTEKMAKMQTDIEEYSKSDKTIEELKGKLTETTTEFETFKTDSSKREINRTKTEALKKSFEGKINKDSVDLIVSTYNLDDITVDSKGDVVDFEQKFEAVKTARPTLIITENLDNNSPPDADSKKNVDASKQTDEEYFAAQKADKKE